METSTVRPDATGCDYTVDDARLLLAALRCAVEVPPRTFAGRAGDPVQMRSRYCCAAVGLDALIARAQMDDPRCPCARRADWHAQLVEARP